jgi:hypothetical protein
MDVEAEQIRMVLTVLRLGDEITDYLGRESIKLINSFDRFMMEFSSNSHIWNYTYKSTILFQFAEIPTHLAERTETHYVERFKEHVEPDPKIRVFRHLVQDAIRTRILDPMGYFPLIVFRAAIEILQFGQVPCIEGNASQSGYHWNSWVSPSSPRGGEDDFPLVSEKNGRIGRG